MEITVRDQNDAPNHALTAIPGAASSMETMMGQWRSCGGPNERPEDRARRRCQEGNGGGKANLTAFDVRILPRRAWCGADGGQADRVDRPTECGIEGRVAVVDEEARLVSFGQASRSCWRVHVDVGCRVTSTCRIRRRS